MTSLEKAKLIVTTLDEKKGRQLRLLDISRLSTLGDYFVLVSAGSNTQARALADEVEEQLWKQGSEDPRHIEGQQNGEWILMDYGDVMVHIFLDEQRQFYDLEHLWSDAPQVDISSWLKED